MGRDVHPNKQYSRNQNPYKNTRTTKTSRQDVERWAHNGKNAYNTGKKLSKDARRASKIIADTEMNPYEKAGRLGLKALKAFGTARTGYENHRRSETSDSSRRKHKRSGQVTARKLARAPPGMDVYTLQRREEAKAREKKGIRRKIDGALRSKYARSLDRGLTFANKWVGRADRASMALMAAGIIVPGGGPVAVAAGGLHTLAGVLGSTRHTVDKIKDVYNGRPVRIRPGGTLIDAVEDTQNLLSEGGLDLEGLPYVTLPRVNPQHHHENRNRGGDPDENPFLRELIDASYMRDPAERIQLLQSMGYTYIPELSSKKALVALTQDGQPVVVFRGSNDTKDFVTDGKIAAGHNPARVKHAQRLIEKVGKYTGRDDTVAVGHSLGGYLAQRSMAPGGALTYNKYTLGGDVANPYGQRDYRTKGDFASHLRNQGAGITTHEIDRQNPLWDVRGVHSNTSPLSSYFQQTGGAQQYAGGQMNATPYLGGNSNPMNGNEYMNTNGNGNDYYDYY